MLVSKNSKQHVNGAVVTGESSSLSLSPRVWCPGGKLNMNQPRGMMNILRAPRVTILAIERRLAT